MYRPDVNVMVKDLVGVPFVLGGRNPKTGLDCLGLMITVMGRMGIDAPDCPGYETATFGEVYPVLFATGKWTEIPGPEPGAVAAMALNREQPDMICHCGICIDHRRIIHTLENRGVSIIPVNDRFFARTIKGYYAWIG